MRWRRNCGDLPVLGDLPPASRDSPVVRIGRRTVPIERIVGTVSRCCDFDRCFRVLRRHLEDRLDAVRRRWPNSDFPPIRVQQRGDDFFVVDGHHRVALARERGMGAIDADVLVVA